MDGDDYGLGGTFERCEERGEVGAAPLPCLDGFREFVDIGAGDERTAASDEDNGRDGVVRDGGCKRRREAFGDAGTQGIDEADCRW